MLLFYALIMTAGLTRAESSASADVSTARFIGPEAYCAGLLETAIAPTPEAREDVRAALGTVVGRLIELRRRAEERPDAARGVRRPYREFWRASGPAGTTT